MLVTIHLLMDRLRESPLYRRADARLRTDLRWLVKRAARQNRRF